VRETLIDGSFLLFGYPRICSNFSKQSGDMKQCDKSLAANLPLCAIYSRKPPGELGETYQRSIDLDPKYYSL
jgi:hypothetical protein